MNQPNRRGFRMNLRSSCPLASLEKGASGSLLPNLISNPLDSSRKRGGGFSFFVSFSLYIWSFDLLVRFRSACPFVVWRFFRHRIPRRVREKRKTNGYGYDYGYGADARRRRTRRTGTSPFSYPAFCHCNVFPSKKSQPTQEQSMTYAGPGGCFCFHRCTMH